MTAESVAARTGARTGPETSSRRYAASAAPDLTDLLQAVIRRDEAALGQLYDFTAGKLYGLARTILGNGADAEEVVCDTYAQAWQSAWRFDPDRGSVLAWLLMICRSRALDLLRQRRARACAEDAAGSEVEEAVEPAPEALLHQIEEGTAIHRALAELTPLRRQLVALAFFKGMSHQEIASAMRLPIGTVKSHLRRSLQSLRAVLDIEEDL
jgi:RNA polymerase sigma-70 factor (ECF subfamily)